MEKIKRFIQIQDDDYYMKTLTIGSFSTRMVNSDKRESCRKILSTIGCQDIMATISKVSFSEDRKKMRKTMSNNNDLNNATSMF